MLFNVSYQLGKSCSEIRTKNVFTCKGHKYTSNKILHQNLNRLSLIKRIFQSLTFFGFIAEPQSDCGVGCRGGHQDL